MPDKEATTAPTTTKASLPVGPIVDDACVAYSTCGRPEAEHRTSFMDRRNGVIDHDYVAPAPRPYDHERVPAMIMTEWHCHVCGGHNDVWGTGATEGYMQCSNTTCLAWSWLDFDPHGFEDAERITPPVATGDNHA